MKIINVGQTYEVYGDDLQVFSKLPAGAYHVNFSKMTGFSLSTHPDIEIKEKVYGVHNEKVDKVLNSYKLFERNLGVILSGSKGIGKSMFAKLLSIRAIENGLPVIVVDQFLPGIARYIESIEQEAVVLFDEFDKTFGGIKQEEGAADAQTSLLTLFDGISPGKKLFVITCNDLHNVSDYLVNRPGRFHYHFRFDYPSADEIRAYLRDNLKEEFYPQIEDVVSFSYKAAINFDCLRAIAFELNLGSSFSEAIKDLNIVNTEAETYNVEIHMANGETFTSKGLKIDLFDENDVLVVGIDKGGNNPIDIRFNTEDTVFDNHSGAILVPGDCVRKDYIWDRRKDLENIDVTSVVLHRKMPKAIHYVV